jgi:hypothetical protein
MGTELSFVIPAQAGIQYEKTCEANRTVMLSHLRGGFLMRWIPAFAGMTLGA